jgi:hypothetical protein
VGSDRGLKALALYRVSDLDLGPVREGSPVTIDVEETLRDALSQMLLADADYARVCVNNEVTGTITIDQVREVVR